jgi:hypothetical protein
MALIALSEFKSTLGVGNLYPDAELQGVMDAAEDVILSMLQQYAYAVDRLCCTTANTIKLRTTTEHDFYVGQTVSLSGLVPGQYNGQATVATLINDYELTVIKSHGQTPFSDEHPLIPPGRIADSAQLDVYDTIEEVREAALAVAVDIWQSRVAPGGQIEGIDFTPGPYRLGRSLYSRVSGLLGRWVDTSALCG